jgi:putative zinc finger protein
MWQTNSHLSDQQVLRKLDGELSASEARQAEAHLAACWTCRARLQELESAVEEFARIHGQGQELESVPPANGPRALLKARLALLAAEPGPRSGWFAPVPRLAGAVALGVMAAGLVLAGAALYRYVAPHSGIVIVSIPDSNLTPGAAVLGSRGAVCSQTNVKNKTVPVALQRKVFEEYGITRAEPRDYEVDYLITPALGGADDIHNLWPHSYKATVWNAEVKDALEDRLRELVCSGDLDLTEAQQELASNWISAYKKYFHTDSPVGEPQTPHRQ